MENTTRIKCPSCQTSIDVQDILSRQLEENYRRQYDTRMAAEQKKFDEQMDQLRKAEDDLAQRKRRENELFQERLDKRLREESKSLEERLKLRLQEENAEQLQALQTELNTKSDQLKELNRTRAELEKTRREKEEMKLAIEADAQRQLSEALQIERERIRKSEEDRNELRIRELQKQLEDQKKLTEEMKRKQEQGSMQLQGEVMELAIEEWLAASFPLDTIEEIKKGARGGDCLQTVHTRARQNCGTIYYESKRTKEFQPSWIEKFKADIRDRGADIGVLVTDALPPGMDRLGMREGIWICTYDEFKGLCTVLRETVIQISNVVSSQENKGDKMSMLYDYLTSNTFRMQVEAIVEGFTQMKADLDAEKRSMQRIWKQREKQLDKVIVNTIDMYGSVKGIAGSAVQAVRALELTPGDDPADEENED